MIYKTPREVLTALLDGKYLKSTSKIYRMYTDRDSLVYLCMDNDGYITEYSASSDEWYKLRSTSIIAKAEWEEGIPIPTIVVNDIEIPEPLRVAPTIGTIYYVASIKTKHSLKFEWGDTLIDNRLLEAGYVQLTKEGALEQLKVLQTIFKKQ